MEIGETYTFVQNDRTNFFHRTYISFSSRLTAQVTNSALHDLYHNIHSLRIRVLAIWRRASQSGVVSVYFQKQKHGVH